MRVTPRHPNHNDRQICPSLRPSPDFGRNDRQICRSLWCRWSSATVRLVALAAVLLLMATVLTPAQAVPTRQACAPLTDGQLVAQVIGAPLRGPGVTAEATRLAAEHAGTVVLLGSAIETAEQVRGLVDALDAAAPAGLPPLIAVDEEGGRVARFGRAGLATHLPSARQQAATMTPDQVEAAAAGLGAQLADLGVDWDLAPVLDLTDAPADTVIGDRSYSTDPGVAGTYAAAFAAGLGQAGLVTSGKHFPDHGMTTVDTHRAVAEVTVDATTLSAVHLQPYRVALPQLDSIMLSHLRVSSLDPDLPATLSAAAVDFLRAELGWHGPLVTDDLSMQALAAVADQPTAALMALDAGLDVLLVGDPQAAEAVHGRLLAALGSGELPRERLRQAVRQALTLKGITGPGASCLLGLPEVEEADAVQAPGGPVHVVLDGVRHEVPDPETLRSAVGSAPVTTYSAEEVGGLPAGAPLVSVRRFEAAVVSAPGTDPLDLAVARAGLSGMPADGPVVVVTDPRGWVGALAASRAVGGVVLPAAGASAERVRDAIAAVAGPGASVTVVGPPVEGLEAERLDTADPVAAALAGGPLPAGDTLLVADADHPGLLSLLPWIARGGVAVRLVVDGALDPRVAEEAAAHERPVLTLGVDGVAGEALPGSVTGLVGWMHAQMGEGHVVVAAGLPDLLAALPLAAAARAVPILGLPGAAVRTAVGAWDLPPGRTRTLYTVGVDPEPLGELGIPTVYGRRPGG